MAGHEGGHWTTELGDWIHFLRWRKRNFDRRVKDVSESSEPPLPDVHDVDAYALHLEFREHLLEIVTNPKKHAFVRDSRKRLDTLELQLAEMRAERGLPADDNPPPPALVALWEDEAAKKAAELAALPPIDQPAFRKRPRGVPPDPPRPWKRKRERAEDHSDEVAARAPAAMEQPPSAKRPHSVGLELFAGMNPTVDTKTTGGCSASIVPGNAYYVSLVSLWQDADRGASTHTYSPDGRLIVSGSPNSLENKNEARIIQDISRLIVPSAESLALWNKNYKRLVESVNEGWNNSVPLTSTRPQPDYSVGFKRDAFTEDQLAKLSPFIGNFIAGDQSFFMGTYYMYFPFLTCEVKCGAAALDIADRQNAHSMTLAVRSIVKLFCTVKREDEVNRKILAFSVSHDHQSVRIYDGKEKWTTYQFTKNVYDTWMPKHFENICSAIDQLPSDLNFDVPPLSEATGLSQDLGNLMQSDASCASLPDERGSQSSNAEQQAVTPGTSFSEPKKSEPKRRKGDGLEGPSENRTDSVILVVAVTTPEAGGEAEAERRGNEESGAESEDVDEP
ncbi:hypothetical protein B0J18DRAFT_494180 [Chaetomium sp. MPI-SDFR-AT-0129]|nr:hypothetical protein B0J18DRAFT_494180 [Chaetomium sp. MPI-SDFR-AT-0129]